ncbi:MAG: hypothetical protein JWL90_1206 [Chthoniobacteraceae bacterium]|nr:hypothetical protein [Chthoniobacteraceae bacterium]
MTPLNIVALAPSAVASLSDAGFDHWLTEVVRFFVEASGAPYCTEEEKRILTEALLRWRKDYAACRQAERDEREATVCREESWTRVKHLALPEKPGHAIS